MKAESRKALIEPIIENNPVILLVLGICSALAVTSRLLPSLIMSLALTADYWLRVTTKKGTHSRRQVPPRYAWADPRYDVAQASMVPCLRDLLGALRGEGPGETTGADNLKTMELTFAAYDSADSDTVIKLRTS